MPKYTDHLPCDWPFLKKFRTGTDQLKLPSSVEAIGVAGVPRNHVSGNGAEGSAASRNQSCSASAAPPRHICNVKSGRTRRRAAAAAAVGSGNQAFNTD